MPATRTWDGLAIIAGRPTPTTDANWANPGNWAGDTLPAVGDDLVFPASALRKAGQVNNFPAGTAFNSIRYEGSGYSVTGSAINLGAGGISALNISGTNTLGLNLILDGNRNIDVSGGFVFNTFSAGTLVVNGAVSGGGRLGKVGAGILELAGTTANTLVGTVAVTAGTLRLNKSPGVNAVSSPLTVGLSAATDPGVAVVLAGNNQIANDVIVTVNARGTLDLGGFSDSFGALNLTGGLVKTGAGTLTLGGNVTATSALGNAARIEGSLALGGAARVFTVDDGPAETDLLVTAVVSGSSTVGVTKEGTGRMELSAANPHFKGGMTVNGGFLRASNGQALGTPVQLGTTVNGGATLELVGNLNGANSLSEGITLNGTGVGGIGALVIAGGAGLGAQLTGPVTLASAATIRADSPAALNGVVSGGGALTKVGTATLSLTGDNNAFTGAITINAGTLRAGHANALGMAAAGTTVAAGASLDASFAGASSEPLTLAGAGANPAVGALTGDATWNGPITLTADTTVSSFVQPQGTGNDGFVGTVTLGGVISGAFDVTIGQGFVQFTGAAANTYTGDTLVTNGAQLQLNKAAGVAAVPGGSLTVNNGAVTVSAAGQIADAVPVAVTAGRLKIDADETVGPLTFNNSFVDGIGTLTLGGDVTVNGTGDSSLRSNVALGNGTRTFTVNAGATLGLSTPGTAVSGGAAAGLTKAGAGTLFLSVPTAYGGATTVNGGVLVRDAELLTPVVVNAGGTLAGGPGPLANVTGAGGTLNPGFQIGTFPTTNVFDLTGPTALNAASVVHLDLGGTAPGFEHDQLHVAGAGTLNLGNARLEVAFRPGFQSVVGNRYTIIQNDTANPVGGQFTNAAGQPIATPAGEVFINGQRFLVTYNDGDGNDVVLTHVNSGSALQNPAITSSVAGGVAVLSGTIVEPDAADGFFLDVNWGDGSPPETFVFPPDAPRNVSVSHTYLSSGTFPVSVAWRDDAGQGNNATLTATVSAKPLPAAGGIMASLVTKKVGKSKKLVVRVFTADGQLKGEIVSPFQKPAFKGIVAAVVDTDGDGTADAVQLSGRKGTKVLKRTVSV